LRHDVNQACPPFDIEHQNRWVIRASRPKIVDLISEALRQLCAGAEGKESAVIEDGDSIAELHRLLAIVRCKDDGASIRLASYLA
jgi:hypothetical protein